MRACRETAGTLDCRLAPPAVAVAGGRPDVLNYGLPLDSYYNRRDGGLRNDSEQLKLSREERAKVEKFARTCGMEPADLHTVLTAMAECEAHPRSIENVALRRDDVREQLRLEAGSVEERDALLQRYLAFSTAIAEQIPTLAARANHIGAGEHIDIVRVGSRYPNLSKEVK